ncbi:MAG: hypothetical protein V4484_02255 [Pseudomonadota bacterium]
MARTNKQFADFRYAAPLNGAEIGGVVTGLLAGAGFTFLIFLFSAAGAGNNGMGMFNATIKPIVVALYLATVVSATTFLFLRRGSAALIVAWLPVILLVLGTQILNVVSWVN